MSKLVKPTQNFAALASRLATDSQGHQMASPRPLDVLRGKPQPKAQIPSKQALNKIVSPGNNGADGRTWMEGKYKPPLSIET